MKIYDKRMRLQIVWLMGKRAIEYEKEKSTSELKAGE